MSAVLDFTQDLWTSILTPGTTPALVKATHFSFACLLLTLLFLLIATRNIHFVFLTIIASGLWAAITWFIREIEIEKAKQQQEKKKEESKSDDKEEDASASTTATTASKSPARTKSRKV